MLRRTPRLALAVPPLILTGLLSVPAAAAQAAPPRLTWQTTSAPFGLSFRQGDRQLTAEAAGAVAGPGGRLAYQVGGSATSQDGATYHRVTDLISTPDGPRGTAYTLAPDQP